MKETIDICISSLFDKTESVAGIAKNFFKTLLELAVLNSYFLFDNVLYKQEDGVGMGLPLGPTLANIFLCFHEQRWLKDCPSEFRPQYFRRYIDDCFLIFDDFSKVDKFLEYLNCRHPRMKFTKEVEQNGSIPFLDVNVKKLGDKFSTSVYRKPSFTGLGLSYFSFIPYTIKKAVLNSAIFRAFQLCSDFKLFDSEIKFLRTFFRDNGFPTRVFDFHVRLFLDRQYAKLQNTFDAPKLKKYFVLPYFGDQSMSLRKELTDLLTSVYPYLDPKVVLRNTFTIGSIFRFKDRIPKACLSGVIYKFSCSSCEESYIGSTHVRLISRVCQHMGISDRTGSMLVNPKPSSIKDHSDVCGTAFSISDFTILRKSYLELDLRLLESLYIFTEKPKLNAKNSALPLNVVV